MESIVIYYFRYFSLNFYYVINNRYLNIYKRNIWIC